MAFTFKAAMTLLVATVFLIGGCTTLEESKAVDSEQYELSRISVLALDNNIQIKPGDTFSWHGDLAVIGADDTVDSQLVATLRADIEKGVKQFQHPFLVAKDVESHFKLAAMVVINKEGEESFSLVNHFGIDPGLGNSQLNHDKGALVLVVTNKANVLLWRGVVQIFTAEELDEKSRNQRRERAIHLLLKELFSKTVAADIPAASA